MTENQKEVMAWLEDGAAPGEDRPSHRFAQTDDQGRRVWLMRGSHGFRTCRSLEEKGLVKTACSNSRTYDIVFDCVGRPHILDDFAAL